MELVIVIVVLAAVVWFFFFKDKKEVSEAISPAPYKIESEPIAESSPVQIMPEVPLVSVIQTTKKPRKAKLSVTPPIKSTPKPSAKSPVDKVVNKPRTRKPKMTIAK